MAPALRVAAKIAPYRVVVLGSGPATAVVLRLVWRDLLTQRYRLYMSIRPSYSGAVF